MSTYGPDAAAEVPAARHTEVGGWPWFGRARWLLLVAGLLAGLVAFAIGEKTHDLVQAEKVKKNLMGNTILEPTEATNLVAATRNAAATFGVLGLCLGASLGIAGGLARRSIGGALAGGLAGALLGLASGAGVTWAILPRFIAARDYYFDYDLVISVGMHMLLWGLLGAGAGLAFVVGLRRYRLGASAFIAGLIGAALGAVAYDIIGAVLFSARTPTSRSPQPGRPGCWHVSWSPWEPRSVWPRSCPSRAGASGPSHADATPAPEPS